MHATVDPAPPVVKFVANVWHQAHRRDADGIALALDHGVFKLTVGDQVYDPPPANLFPHFVREFLRYSKIRVWPWTNRIRKRQCSVNAGNTCFDKGVVMQSVTVSPKFQVVIPRAVRDHLHLCPGQKVQVVEYAGRVELIPERDISELKGFVKGIDTSFAREADRI